MEIKPSKRILLIALLTSCYALGQNIVVNGDFTNYHPSTHPRLPDNWTLSGTTSETFVDTSINPPAGGNSLTFGSIFSQDNIWTQTLSTTPGTQYTLSFYLQSDGSTGDIPPNDFSATFGATTALSINDQPLFSWTSYNSTVTASATSTDLVFAGRNSSNYYYLGNVSVVPIITNCINSWNATSGAWETQSNWTGGSCIPGINNTSQNNDQASFGDQGANTVAVSLNSPAILGELTISANSSSTQYQFSGTGSVALGGTNALTPVLNFFLGSFNNPQTLSLPITLNQNATIISKTGSQDYLKITTPVTLNGKNLTIQVDTGVATKGNIEFTNQLTGSNTETLSISNMNATFSSDYTSSLNTLTLSNSNLGIKINHGSPQTGTNAIFELQNATLNGNLNVIWNSPNSVTKPSIIPVLHSQNTINGTIANINYMNFPASIIPSIQYSSQEIDLFLVPAINSNTSPSSMVITSQLISTDQINSIFLRNLQTLNQKLSNTSDTKTAANSLFNEESLIAANNSEMLRKTRQLEKKSKESQKPWSAYIGPIGSYGQIDMPHNSKTTYGSGGALTGFDYAFQNVGSFPFYIGLGTALEYRNLFGHIHQNSGSFDSQRINLTVYNSYVPKKVKDLNINLLLGYAYCFDSMHRKTGVNNSKTAIANTHEQLFNGVLDFEYTVKHEFRSKFKQSISWVPFANIQYIYDAINNYKEKNAGIYNLKYNLPNFQSLLSSLGSRFYYAKSTQNLDFTAELDFTWQRQYLAQNKHLSYLAFNSSSIPGVATINGLSRNQYLLGLDLLFKIYNKVNVEANCDLLWSSRVFDSTFYLGIGSDF